MNYLEIVRGVRQLSGMQGTGPASVLTAVGVEAVIVQMVQSAYVDIQNMREEFNFLNAKHQFFTSMSKDTYTYLDVFGSSTPDIKKYDLSSFRITNSNGRKSYLNYITRESLEDRYMNSMISKIPTTFTVDYADNSLVFKPIADAIYTVDLRYWKNPELLTTDAQVPKLPSTFHQLILYKALEKLSIYLTSPELFTEYSLETARMSGQLMRLDVPKMRMGGGSFA